LRNGPRDLEGAGDALRQFVVRGRPAISSAREAESILRRGKLPAIR